MQFQIHNRDKNSKARTGTISISGKSISTPVFMPVGTAASVKGLSQHFLMNNLGAEIILNNTYHLYLRPGTNTLNQAGGAHKFMNWPAAILTDSGGYQVYSLSKMRKISEEGAKFQSHIDGSYHLFTPENVIDTQRKIGANIIMAFDECPPYPSDYTYVKKSMHLTHRWLDRCIDRFNETDKLYGEEQVLAPIVQGGTYNDLRIESAQYISDKGLDINAIGGLSVGEPKEMMYEHTQEVCEILPDESPRYLMGVGTPENILDCISYGIDMFDCVLPTRNARHGLLYTTEGIINIKNLKWKNDFSAIDPNLENQYSEYYNKSYLRHLIHSKEMLGFTIASAQNLSFFFWLIEKSKEKIKEGVFNEWKNDTIKKIMRRL